MNNSIKNKRVSKILMLLVLLCSFCITAQAAGKVFSLTVNNQPMSNVLKQIEKASGVHIAFIYEDVSNYHVSLNVKDVSAEQAVAQAIKSYPLTYQVKNDGKVISIQKKQQAQGGAVKNVFSGVVTDADGLPLPGVNIQLDGRGLGVTDNQGNFNCTAPPTGGTLTFSFVGFEPFTKRYSSPETGLRITLQEKSNELGDVVITGIFTREKESFTGSAVTFSKTELKSMGTQNVLQSLKTLDPAFAIIDDTQFGSDPNRLPNLEIRGKSSMLGTRDDLSTDPNQPLFILDGFESSLEVINDLDINRIESITILKDAASTAIYGSKAANGVVVVETVKPTPGKLQVSYTGNFNMTLPDLSSYNMMNASEKLDFELLAGRYDVSKQHNSNLFAQEDVRITQMYYDRLASIARGVDTDWLAQPVRVGQNMKHSLYVQGGSEEFMFGIGGYYNGVSGVMKDSERKVMGGNLDLIYRVKNFQFSNKASMTNAKFSNPTVGFSEYVQANPYYAMTDAEGQISPWLEYDEDSRLYMANPVYNASLNSYNNGNDFTLTDNFQAEWTPSKEWKVRARLGVSYTDYGTEKFVSPENTDQILNKSVADRGEYYKTTTKGLSYEGDVTVTYAKVFAEKHRINAVLGGNVYSYKATLDGYSAEGFPSGDFTSPSFANQYTENSVPSYNETISRSVNAYLNAGYSYDDRYLIDLSLRQNGSSVFGSSQKFNTTWSVGLGWNIHKEKWVKENLTWVNYLKLRASIGNPGNQSFDSGRTMVTYSLGSGVLNPFGLGALPQQIGNPDLKWQITQDKNLGFDLTVLNNRLSVVFDTYHKDTDPLLIGITMPYSSGTTSYFTNAGYQISTGTNFTVQYHIFRDLDKRLLWSVRLNGRTSRNEINGIGNKLDAFNNNGRGSTTTRYFDGADPDDIWVVKSAGIDPSTGKELFIKPDGTYTYDYSYDDEQVCGNTRPDIEGIVGTSFTYKGFSASLNFRYRMGAEVFNYALMNKVENIDYYYNQDKRALYQRWQQAGDIAPFKNIRDANTSPMSSRFIQKENSLTLESIQFNYEWIDGWVEKLKLSSCKVFVSMRDAFYLSTIRAERGTDYPYARTLEAGVSLNF